MYRKWLNLLILLLIYSIPLHAQEVDLPLIAYFEDAFYQLDGDTLVPYDECLPDEAIQGQFIQSPDGTRFVIPTIPSVVSEAREALGSLGGVRYSSNYWVCDVTTDTLERVVVQPGADDAFNEMLPPIEVIIDGVVWSPDSTQLAWTEFSIETQANSVIILDLATEEITRFVIDVADEIPPDIIAWTEDGILLWSFVQDFETFFNIETLIVVDVPSQSITAQYEILNGGETDDFYYQRQLVQTAEGLQYAIEFAEAGWVLYDIMTGESTPTIGSLAITIPDADNSLILQFALDSNFNYNWQAVNSEVLTEDFLDYPPQRIALSPDGMAVAYVDTILHVLDADGNQIDVPDVDACLFDISDDFREVCRAQILWGADALTFIEQDEMAASAPAMCDGAPPIQTAPGDTARVIAPTVPNRIRSEPTTNSEILGEIPGGGEFIVSNGPVCAEGYTWFEIDYNGTLGWTVEGAGDSYFIEPVSELP